jgi:eukaryotic-like serine/threonine-protein kinase
MPTAPDLAGHALDGRYELHEKLGEGSFGRVYRGLDRRLGRPVAVKVIKPWWAEDSAWVERFEREARLLARIHDPGVVQIFDIGHAEEGPYYVAELVDGESLAERLRSGPLAPATARAIAEQLCRSLASAHRQGVVHCDVKPANVLLAAGGEVKVGDFGVARLAESTSQVPSATVAGTPRYMSPEQARGKPTTAATDVYSAGVVLYEMLAGEPPFADGSPVELGLRHLQDPPPELPAGIPGPLRDVVARALAKDPRKRFPDADAMADALHRAGAGEDPAAAPQVGLGAANGNGAPPSEARTISGRAGEDAPTVARTLLAPPRTPGGPGEPKQPLPPERRRRLAVLAAVLALLALAVALLLLNGSPARTTVPDLRNLPRAGVQARARRLRVHPVFSSRHSAAARGIAIAQSPAPGTRVDAGSEVHVTLSSGPPPVSVPALTGQTAGSAESALDAAGLRWSLDYVVALSSRPGVVTHQSPAPPASVPRGSTVTLSVAESPRWRTLTSFSGVDDGRSLPFRIKGRRWRVSYDMSFRGTCVFLVFCEGPSAEARELEEGGGEAPEGGSAGSFELSEGEGRTHVYDTGPGLYQLVISGGRDSAGWRIDVQDWY